MEIGWQVYEQERSASLEVNFREGKEGNELCQQKMPMVLILLIKVRFCEWVEGGYLPDSQADFTLGTPKA